MDELGWELKVKHLYREVLASGIVYGDTTIDTAGDKEVASG